MYQALYRKWRPRTFDEVVGQQHITETLKRQVESGQLFHAYLFTGTRGTGKTTCAKLLARAVNCPNTSVGNPCNQCDACRGIENGSILDVLELDAASNNRVDDIRTILDEAIYLPSTVQKRVYIIDEVHMLSSQAFNALLQILEEPPAHLMFILATTEIHKVPATIKSRCQQFSFKRIRPEDIAERLLYVAGQEKIALTQNAAGLIARLADGGMRDALSLLDQCRGTNETVDEERVYASLGLAGNLETADLMAEIAEGNAESVLKRVSKLYDGGRDMVALLNELASLTRDILVRHTAPGTGDSLMTGGFDNATMNQLSDRFDVPRLVQMLHQLQKSAADMAWSSNRRTDAELCLLMLCDPSLDHSTAGLEARISKLEKNFSAPAAGMRPPEPIGGGSLTAHTDHPDSLGREPDRINSEMAVQQKNEKPEKLLKPESSTEEKQSSGAGVQWPGWSALLEALKTEIDLGDYIFLSNPAMVQGHLDGNLLTLWTNNDFIRDMIGKPAVTKKVEKVGTDLAGFPLRVTVKVGEAPLEEAGETSASAEEDTLEAFLAEGLENLIVE